MSRLPQALMLSKAPPDPDAGVSNAGLPLWVGLGLALAILAAAAVEARIHVRDADEGGSPPRLARIVLTAAVLAGAVTLLLLVDMIARPEAGDELLLMSLVALATCTTIFLVVVTVLDFWLGLFAPRRSRSWLAVAVLVFVLLFFATLGLAVWLEGALDEPFDPELLQLLVVAAAAGITWWSRLPPPVTGVERHFE